MSPTPFQQNVRLHEVLSEKDGELVKAHVDIKRLTSDVRTLTEMNEGLQRRVDDLTKRLHSLGYASEVTSNGVPVKMDGQTMVERRCPVCDVDVAIPVPESLSPSWELNTIIVCPSCHHPLNVEARVDIMVDITDSTSKGLGPEDGR